MSPHVEDGYVPESKSNGGKLSTRDDLKNRVPDNQSKADDQTPLRAPLELKGVLNQFKSFDVTPVIGREYKDVDLAEWLRAPNSDELIRDLAITSEPHTQLSNVVYTDLHSVSQRGVVFFRAQDGITDDLQKELAQRLGELSGKPSSSKLHIHPVSNSAREHGGNDDEISIISSLQAKKIYKGSSLDPSTKKQSSKDNWHSDITFEPVPSDYAILRLTELPGTGGGMNQIPTFQTLTTLLTYQPPRHPLGLRLRAFRPHLPPLPAIPRIPYRNLRPTKIQRSRRQFLLRALHRPPWLAAQHR